MADLDQEGEHLLDALDRTEELRSAVPGMRVAQGGPGSPVLLGITDRRVLVVGRWPVADTDRPLDQDIADAMTCVIADQETTADGAGILGDLELDLDAIALDRLWEHLDGVRVVAGAAEWRTQLRRPRNSAVTAAPSA